MVGEVAEASTIKNLKNLLTFIINLAKDKFTGRLIIDFTEGGIGNAEITEKLK